MSDSIVVQPQVNEVTVTVDEYTVEVSSQGPQGATGISTATVTIGTTTTGAAGSSASVTNTGTDTAAVLNFTIPQGVQGEQGIQGIQGIQGDKGDKGDTGATGATGPKGDKGDTGATGSAATVTVGTTTTLSPGSSATVTNSGTSSAAVFDFAIPQGDKGDKGDTGATGATGATGPSGVIAVTSPITNSGTSTSAQLGIDQSLLTIAQSQVTNLTTDLTGKAALTADQTFTGQQTIATSASTNKGLIVKGSASQSANLQEWQNSAGTTQASVRYDGLFTVPFIRFSGATAAQVPAIIKAATSQTASIQEWQNSSSTVLAKVDPSGNLTANSFVKTGGASTEFLKADGSVTDNSVFLGSTNQSTSTVDVIPRAAIFQNVSSSNGTAYFVFFTPLATMTVSQVSMATSTTAAAGLTLARMGLYTFDGTTATLVARTASDTTLFTASNTLYTRSFDTTGGYPATYTLTAGSRYAFAWIGVGTTAASFAGVTANSLITPLSPRVLGAVSAMSDLPTSRNSFTANTQLIWGRFS